MSSVVIKGDTSGQITLSAPAVAGTNTLTLPTVTATVATDVNGSLYPLTSGTAQASTSGTSIDFTSIPSWVKRITVMFSGVSGSGTSPFTIQLGTGATPTYATSGYNGQVTEGVSNTYYSTAGFVLRVNSTAANTHSGVITLVNLASNTWAEAGNLSESASVSCGVSAGSVPLGAALTAVRITTVNGTDTFDAGSINILYE